MKKQSRRFIFLLLSLMLLATSMLALAGPAAASQAITVSVNGTLVQFDVAPMVIDNRVVVQMKPIFEALGAQVSWQPANPNANPPIPLIVTATKGSDTIVLTEGSYTASHNGKQITLVTPPLIINQHVMVPVRFVSDFLGYNISWDAADRQVDITSPPVAPTSP